MVGRMKRSVEAETKKMATGITVHHAGRSQKPDPRRVGDMGANGQNLEE